MRLPQLRASHRHQPVLRRKGVSFYLNLRKESDISWFQGFRPEAIGGSQLSAPCQHRHAVRGQRDDLPDEPNHHGLYRHRRGPCSAFTSAAGFVFMPIFGMNNGMVPIIGYNFWCLKPDRVKRPSSAPCSMPEAIMLVGFLLFSSCPDKLLGPCSPPADHADHRQTCPARISSFLLVGMGIILSSTFPGAGQRHVPGLIVSVCRQLVVLLPAAWLLSKTGNVNMVVVLRHCRAGQRDPLAFVFFARLDKESSSSPCATTPLPLYSKPFQNLSYTKKRRDLFMAKLKWNQSHDERALPGAGASSCSCGPPPPSAWSATPWAAWCWMCVIVQLVPYLLMDRDILISLDQFTSPRLSLIRSSLPAGRHAMPPPYWAVLGYAMDSLGRCLMYRTDIVIAILASC